MNYLTNFFLLCCSISVHSSELTTLSELSLLQWKHRIILVNNLRHSNVIVDLFEKNKRNIEERDIIWFVLTGDQTSTNYQGALADDFIAKTRESYKIEPGKIMLIGKDGGVKFLLDRLDVEAIFSEIDAMPMRQSEMVH